MKRVKWDTEELVALIDIYHREGAGLLDNLEDELSKLSVVLRNRATKLGIEHDEKYRNQNGLNMMYQNLVYVATEGKQGLSGASKKMYDVYDIYQQNPDSYREILKEFQEIYILS